MPLEDGVKVGHLHPDDVGLGDRVHAQGRSLRKQLLGVKVRRAKHRDRLADLLEDLDLGLGPERRLCLARVLADADLALATGLVGIFFGGLPVAQPAFKTWRAPGLTGGLFPFLFVTIACGACSGFHAIVASGTTSKQLRCEPDAKLIGYGAMLMEAMVAVVYDGPGALRTGARYLRRYRHLADVYTTVAHALGAPIDKFNGAGTGVIRELLA
jgi:hypothetical protein